MVNNYVAHWSPDDGDGEQVVTEVTRTDDTICIAWDQKKMTKLLLIKRDDLIRMLEIEED